MCTLMTFDRDTFTKNRDVILEQIYADSVSNDDGYSLVLSGMDSKNATHLQSLKIDTIISILVVDDSWERFWLHSRAATRGEVTLRNCHGFEANGWFIQHNGILGPKSNRFEVDSLLIADIVEKYGVDAAEAYLMANESFANVFFIHPESGEWRVIRTGSGNLHTDGGNNYSTHAVGPCDKPVARGKWYNQENTEASYSWSTDADFIDAEDKASGYGINGFTDEEMNAYERWFLNNKGA
jgi:hypothetical protein